MERDPEVRKNVSARFDQLQRASESTPPPWVPFEEVYRCQWLLTAGRKGAKAAVADANARLKAAELVYRTAAGQLEPHWEAQGDIRKCLEVLERKGLMGATVWQLRGWATEAMQRDGVRSGWQARARVRGSQGVPQHAQGRHRARSSAVRAARGEGEAEGGEREREGACVEYWYYSGQ